MTIRILLLAVIMTLAGCASNPMTVAPDQELQRPSGDKSQVIFMRSSFVGSAISASLYDVTGGDIEFLGVIANGTKVTYETTPGEHIFMVVSEAADFMEASLAPGKNYYGIATPRMGMWKARFSLWPIKTDPNAEYHTGMSEFSDWVSNTKLVENTDASRTWYENNKESVREKYEDYWPEWQKKSAEDLARRTLVPEDGM